MKTVKKSPHSTNAKVNHLIDNLINEVTNANININSVRGPETQEQAQFNELIAYTNQLRGRPLYYNYLGTGRGHGAYVELTDGSVKLDLINGIGIHVLGHAHPLVLKAGLSVISAIIVDRPAKALLKVRIIRAGVFFCRQILSAFSLAIDPQVDSQA